jgi:hypothetical protein
MKSLLTAIYTKITGTTNTFNTAIGGRFYIEHAPQNTVFPFCCLYVISDTFIPTIFKKDDDSTVLQFSIFDNTPDPTSVLDAFDYLETLVNYSELTVSGYEFIKFERSFSRLNWETDTETWHFLASYNVWIRK